MAGNEIDHVGQLANGVLAFRRNYTSWSPTNPLPSLPPACPALLSYGFTHKTTIDQALSGSQATDEPVLVPFRKLSQAREARRSPPPVRHLTFLAGCGKSPPAAFSQRHCRLTISTAFTSVVRFIQRVVNLKRSTLRPRKGLVLAGSGWAGTNERFASGTPGAHRLAPVHRRDAAALLDSLLRILRTILTPTRHVS